MNAIGDFSFAIEARNFVQAGEASGQIKRILKQTGISGEPMRRAVIASYEAEMNIVIHSIGGELVLTITPNSVMIQAKDGGPGIVNIDLAMEEGYSTASDDIRQLGFGAGLGLPNIRRSVDRFAITSDTSGTLVEMWIDLK